MVERRPILTFLSHALLVMGVAVVAFPIYITVIAMTHGPDALLQVPIPLLPGDQLLSNINEVLFVGRSTSGTPPVWQMMLNSLIMALGITAGKIAISILSAFAIVYFRFPFRMVFFWMIFITLMLPVEVRILPTFEVVSGLNLLNSYSGLILPLIASATATFLFRQVFLTIPDELMEAARIDGASAMRFLIDVVIPMSRTNIAALFVILFIFGWNQYLWPLLITTDPDLNTVVMGIQRMLRVGEATPEWNIIMTTTFLAMVPPVMVVIAMQRLFVKGLIDAEK